VSAAAVAVQNVTKRFATHQALDGLTLEVAPRESVVVLGPSGCGKTTLLRLIAGLDLPDTGEIWLAGVQVAGPRRSMLPPHQRQIGYVFQDLALWPHLTVQQNLEFVVASQRIPRGERKDRIQNALHLVRIDRFASRYPNELSGGEQQRVALARALVGTPRLLLLDEPLSSLDPELRSAMRTELVRLSRSLALTTVYVTHDREDAAVLADRVVEMRAGLVTAIRHSKRTEEPA
jgi:iron(III) transport system ATP-binding protein